LRQRVQAMKENLDEKFKNATQVLTKRVK